MAQFQITGQDGFQVLSHSFSAGPTSGGFTLQFSANGKDWDTYDEPVPAGETLIVTDFAFGQYFRFSGNTDTVDIIY